MNDLQAGAAWLASDPLRFSEFNPAQVRFFKAINNPIRDTLNGVFFLKGNGVGGSWGLMAAWSAIMYRSRNPLFAQERPYGSSWPFLRSARLLSTVEGLKDLGPLQRAIRALFPAGRWEQRKGSGKPAISRSE